MRLPAGTGTPFDATGSYHHLLDPESGESSHYRQSVSVTAPSVTLADGLSTAVSLMPLEDVRKLLAEFDGTTAYLFRDGDRIVV